MGYLLDLKKQYLFLGWFRVKLENAYKSHRSVPVT